MRFDSAGKGEEAHRHVGNLVVKIIAALRIDASPAFRLLNPESPKCHAAQKTKEYFLPGGFCPDSSGSSRYNGCGPARRLR